MQLGIFARTFVRPSLPETFAAVQANGLECVQFNFSCVGLPTLPESIDPGLAHRVRFELEGRSLFMAAVSGTGNLIHPHAAQRAKNLVNLEVLIRACGQLGTSVVTLCTGTRDPNDMWQPHPENHSPEAWCDLIKSLERVLPVAQQCAVVLGVEPEPANVIDSAPKARKLLDELNSPCLKIVFDAANLLQPQKLNLQHEILAQAVDLLGTEIILAHAKDLSPDPNVGHVAAGRGALDYASYLSLLNKSGFKGPIILHSLREDEVPMAVAFLKNRLRSRI